MIGHGGHRWQTTTADLALILFLVVAAAGTSKRAGGHPAPHAAPSPVTQGPPLGVFRPTAGTTLQQWLDAQALDERQIATVMVQRRNAGDTKVVEQGLAYLAAIETAGHAGRLVVQAGAAPDVSVVLSYDRPPGTGTALAAR